MGPGKKVVPYLSASNWKLKSADSILQKSVVHLLPHSLNFPCLHNACNGKCVMTHAAPTTTLM
jgi:hypothetical protein